MTYLAVLFKKMLRARENKRLGLLDPFVLKQAECIRRSWDLQLSKLVDIECNMKGAINSLSADYQNGIFLLSGCSDGSVFINNLCNFTGQPAYTCKEMTRIRKPDHRNASSRSVETVQWYPFDTGLFLSSGMDGILKLWDTNKLEVAEAFKFQGRIFQHHMNNVTSPSSSLVAVASSVNEVLLLDIRTGNRAHELRGHSSLVLSCQWSPRDWYCLATGSNDNSVMIWDIRSNKSYMNRSNQSGEMIKAKHGHAQTSHDGAVNSLTFTKSGLFLLSLGVDSHLRLWNVSTGLNEPVDYGSVPNTTRKPAQMAVSETASKEFVYVPSRGYVLVYSIHTGEKMKSLRGHFGPVNCCCFNPFSFHLYSGAKDGYLLCWRHELLEDDSEERKQSHLNKLYKLNLQGSMVYYPSDI